MRRIYLLDGKEIDSDKCDGFLHKAKTNRGICIICNKEILPNEEYIVFNTPWGEFFHKDCYVEDHIDDVIFGIKIEKRKTFYGIKKTYVICKLFSIQ